MSDKQSDFLKLIKEHQGIIHKICFMYCLCSADKQDLIQEISLQLWRAFPSFKGNSAFSTWMYRVALNTAISQTRKKRIVTTYENVPDITMESTEDFSEEIKTLYKAISHLKRVEKAIILLWLEEKSYEEIAETIGITVSNVSVKIHRIKLKLADLIKKME